MVCCLSLLYTITQILGHYIFKYFFFPVLSLFSFWDSNYMYIRPFYIVPQFLAALFCSLCPSSLSLCVFRQFLLVCLQVHWFFHPLCQICSHKLTLSSISGTCLIFLDWGSCLFWEAASKGMRPSPEPSLVAWALLPMSRFLPASSLAQTPTYSLPSAPPPQGRSDIWGSCLNVAGDVFVEMSHVSKTPHSDVEWDKCP